MEHRPALATLSIAVTLAGCFGTSPSDPPAHASPSPTLVDGPTFAEDGTFDEHARGVVWMDASAGTIFRIDVSSGIAVRQQVQDRAFGSPGRLGPFRVLDDDTVFVIENAVERDGIYGDELRVYRVGQPPVAEWFPPGDLAVDARALDVSWIYSRVSPEESATLCRRAGATEACFDAPVASSGAEPQLFVAASGVPYLLVDAELTILLDGAWSTVSGLSGVVDVVRRGDADFARGGFGEWFLLDGDSATLIEDGTGEVVDAYGDGGRVVLQRASFDGAGGFSSVGGFIGNESSGSTFWTDTVWLEVDPSTGEATEIGHETCDYFPEDGRESPTGAGCGRNPYRIVLTDELVWILGTPIRTLAY